MIRLGLTGSIATGKSTALEVFATLGIPVFSADEAVHRLYRGRAVAEVEALFPGTARDGVVDRAKLASVLIESPGRIAELERVVHPMVREEIRAFLDDAERAGASLAVVDVPLLLESGYDFSLDQVAVTSVPDAVLRERAMARPGMTVEKLDTILARQMPQEDKRRRADHVLDTSGSIEATRRQVADLVEALASEAG